MMAAQENPSSDVIDRAKELCAVAGPHQLVRVGSEVERRPRVRLALGGSLRRGKTVGYVGRAFISDLPVPSAVAAVPG